MTYEQKKRFDFRNLFIFEMANNHQGSVEHGKRIIQEMSKNAREAGVRAGVKLQFRHLDTFIHPDFKDGKDNKHIPRFLSTRLTEEQFGELVEETKKEGLISISTPFDELSVDMLVRLGVEVIKIGSCSAHDWPLLEKVAETGKPVICSTGGLTLKEIDRIVSFFEHRGVHFALMYCVAIYPTPNGKLHLNQIEMMINRYPGVTIGFSTHEDPADTSVIGLAYAKGVRMFEKHVGVATNDIKLNAYSANPDQIREWLWAYKKALEACGHEGERVIGPEEMRDLRSLMRGVYVRKEVKSGDIINREDVFFSIPIQEGQMRSGRFRSGLKADKTYLVNQPLAASVEPKRPTKKDLVYSVIHAVKGMLNEARVSIGHEFSVELSHHYGLEKFHETGCVIVECINREYCKKLIIQLPGQWNPVHYHKLKDETFHVLSGDLNAEIEGHKKTLRPGDTLWVPKGTWHGFGTETGAIVEEVSTTSMGSDSFYIDRIISRLPREQRKTRLLNWGRHQFDEVVEEE